MNAIRICLSCNTCICIVWCNVCRLRSILFSGFQSIPMQDQAAKDKALQSMASMSSAQIVSASAIHNKALAQGIPMPNVRPSYPGGPSGSQVRNTDSLPVI